MQQKTIVGIIIGCLVLSGLLIVFTGGSNEREARPIEVLQQTNTDNKIINPALGGDETEKTRGLITERRRSGKLADGTSWKYRHDTLADSAPTAGANGSPTNLDSDTSDQGAIVTITQTSDVTTDALETVLQQVLNDKLLKVVTVSPRENLYILSSTDYVSRGITLSGTKATVSGIFPTSLCNKLVTDKRGSIQTNLSLKLACQTRSQYGIPTPETPVGPAPDGI